MSLSAEPEQELRPAPVMVLAMLKVVVVAFVLRSEEAKKLVEVALVVVPDVPRKLVRNPLVAESAVAKREVEVALVVVEFTPVKFCSVEEPLTKRFVRVASPELPIEKRDVPIESRTSNKFTNWPIIPRTRSGTADDDVASTVRTALPEGVVVPIEDCVVPVTPPAT